MIDIIATVLVFSIPLSGILGFTVIKLVETLKGKSSAREIQQLQNELLKLRSQNADYQNRLENLETILGSIDQDLLKGMMAVGSLGQGVDNQRKIQEISNQNRQNQYRQQQINQQTNHLNSTTPQPNQLPPLDENFKMILNKLLMKVDNLLDDNKKKF